MDINHINLPASVIVNLYHSSLIEANEALVNKLADNVPVQDHTESVMIKDMQAGWKSLGSNEKNILFIVNSHEAVHLPDNELTFLMGILTACKLSMADIALVNRHNHPEASYKEITRFFASKIVLLFDLEPAEFGLPMNFPKYQLQAFAGNTFLYSHSLKELENDRVEKSKLWVSLKRLFNL